MEIRFLDVNDWEQIQRIYAAHFTDMEFPDFYNDFNPVYTVHEENRIIAVGGLKVILEAVVITDQNESVRKRRDALLQIQNALMYSAEKLHHKRIFAFTYDEQYAKHLEEFGFNPIKESKLLVLEL